MNSQRGVVLVVEDEPAIADLLRMYLSREGFQVLVESAFLSGAGAAIGIGIGVGLAQIVRAVSPLPAAIAPFWMTMSVVMGLGVGVLAGLYPAARAARLDPVKALRQE